MFNCDSIIIAVSQSPRKNIVANTTGLETNKWDYYLQMKKDIQQGRSICIRRRCYWS